MFTLVVGYALYDHKTNQEKRELHTKQIKKEES